MTNKKISIGISDFKKLRDEDYYFVDKSYFIRDIINSSFINLLPRPRRFGKTLNMSMLRYFFEMDYPEWKRSNPKEYAMSVCEDNEAYLPLVKGKTSKNSYLFDGLAIKKWDKYDLYQGHYPVISISLKDAKGLTIESTLYTIGEVLAIEFERHAYLLNKKELFTNRQLKQFHAVMDNEASEVQQKSSLLLLSSMLEIFHKMPVIVIIDEYDSPIHAAYMSGYYSQMIEYMRCLLGSVMKDNTHLMKGVLTGIMQIAKESIFSGLNNLKICNLLETEMNTAFGFTEQETIQLLSNFEMETYKEKVRHWYDGYLFGNEIIYNPWSVLMLADNKEHLFQPYWVNTASDDFLRDLLTESPSEVKCLIETIVKGGSVVSSINDNTVFPELTKSPENVWSFLFYSGYLKATLAERTPGYANKYNLQIPNLEISYVFRSVIKGWISESPVHNYRLEIMLRALINGKTEEFEAGLNEFVINTLSFFDTGGRNVEKVYQAFLLGMLVNLPDYIVDSNREAGLGRYDILLTPVKPDGKGIIMELKTCNPDNGESVQQSLNEALKQINEKQYEAALRKKGITTIQKLAITFDGKKVWIKSI